MWVYCQKAILTTQLFCDTLSEKNSSDKSVEILSWCRKFCPTKNFVCRKFCPIFQYKSQAKIGQNCRIFGLVSKILSDEFLSDRVSQKKEKVFEIESFNWLHRSFSLFMQQATEPLVIKVMLLFCYFCPK